MQKGFPDVGEFETLWCPIINIINVVTGNNEILSPINSYYYNTGINYTNVRTLFGTVFLNSTMLEFIVYTLLLSSMMYSLKLATIKWNNIYMYIIYFFESTLLAMGWFEFYYFHLIALELPMLVLLLWLLDWCLHGKDKAVAVEKVG